jgi:AP-2 complex subunit mu-1
MNYKKGKKTSSSSWNCFESTWSPHDLAMISAIYLINLKGEILIYRSYRDDVSRAAADAFRMQVLAAKEFRSPVQVYEKASFFHIRSANMYLVAATRENVNASMVFEFLYQLVGVFKSYFGGTFEEDAVRDNFPLVYELLDEVMDFGYPQNCSADLLKTFIMQDGQAMDPAAFKVATSIAPQVTGAVSWRREGIKHVKNEVFLDVIENVNLLMSAKGTVLRSDVTGEIVMKTFLTGMPECKFGLNDKVMMETEGKKTKDGKDGGIEMEDVSFHQVRSRMTYLPCCTI